MVIDPNTSLPTALQAQISGPQRPAGRPAQNPDQVPNQVPANQSGQSGNGAAAERSGQNTRSGGSQALVLSSEEDIAEAGRRADALSRREAPVGRLSLNTEPTQPLGQVIDILV